MPAPSPQNDGASLGRVLHFHKVISADVVLRLFQAEVTVEIQLYPSVLRREELPGEQQVSGVAVGVARALNLATFRHYDGLFFSVQVCEVIAVITPYV